MVSRVGFWYYSFGGQDKMVTSLIASFFMPCLIVFICLGLPHENYTFGDSSETKYAVKPKKQSQGGLSGAIIFTPDQLDFLETLKGSSKRQGEQLLRYKLRLITTTIQVCVTVAVVL